VTTRQTPKRRDIDTPAGRAHLGAMATTREEQKRATYLRTKIKKHKASAEEIRELAAYEARLAPQGRRPSVTWLRPVPIAESTPSSSAGPSALSAGAAAGAPPTLETIGTEADGSAPAVVSVSGQCPGCRAPITDEQKVCPACGVWVRLNECRKCHKSVTPGSFCQECGTRAPIAPEKPIDAIAPPPTVTSAGVVEVEGLGWTMENAGGTADLIDFLLLLDECEELNDDEKKQITLKMVPVLNKYARGSGKYAELINLGGSLTLICAPRLLIRHVIQPRRERKAMELERMKLEKEREMQAERHRQALELERMKVGQRRANGVSAPAAVPVPAGDFETMSDDA
jgi:double zinc ribbon protein